ncbi:autotransporter outer membrane beta-barrel domain-containing protein [Pseudochelatococcus sp. G4_1912]|uniref:autotransporter outer membrane beta-barrel domain-containing protein n=1 Tax=Pseudochelatococcus sp. G4_1912 TaxID=3114288 RepID=UPI0039C72AAC
MKLRRQGCDTGGFQTALWLPLSPGYQQAALQYDARTLQVYGEASYTFGVQSITAEPFVNLAYVAHRVDGIEERDLGLGTGLYGHTSDANTGFSTAGVRLSHTVEVGSVEGRVHGMIGWRYAFGDIRPRAASCRRRRVLSRLSERR